MNILINSKGIKITEGMKQAIESKLEVLDKFLNESHQIKVSISNVKKQISVCMMVVYEGKLVKIEKSGDDFYYIINDIGDRLKEKLEKLHTKKIKKQKDQEKALQKLEYDESSDESEFMNQEIISKRKKISLTQMTPEEAIEQMELLGHESFIFSNIETGKPCMIYSRFDGKYSLIETE